MFSIQARGVCKTFGSGRKTVEAVRGIDLDVKRGEAFGLLGPNGAGKTTMMRMLCTLLLPTRGSLVIDGLDVLTSGFEVRRRIGYVSQKGGMEPKATGRENLVLQTQLFGVGYDHACKRAQGFIERFRSESWADRRVQTYSGGQRRMFDLAAALINKPAVLFLDEPTTGLDPQSRARVWDEVRLLNASGTTVFLTTHYLDEADALCHRVAIVDKGIVVASGSPAELKAKVATDTIVLGLAAPDIERATNLIRSCSFVRDIQIVETDMHVYVGATGDRDALVPELMQRLHSENITVNTIQLSRATLEDVFLKLTGRTLRDVEN